MVYIYSCGELRRISSFGHGNVFVSIFCDEVVINPGRIVDRVDAKGS